jgi:glycosyltransferase involved in cell wall biosynthesis
MRIGVFYPDVFPLSMKIYVNTIMQYLESKDCSFALFNNVDIIPQDVDLYWDPRVGGGALPAINKNIVSKPIVVTLHGTALFTLPLSENRLKISDTLYMLQNRRNFKRDWRKYEDHFEKIITVSEYAKREIVENLSLDAERIVPIYHAFDADLFYPQKDETVDKYFLHISVFQPKKNIERIIKAYNSLGPNKEIPKLVLVAPGFKGTIKNKNIILITNTISRVKVANYMQNAFAFIMPSLHESFGLPILEAMACGVPVITSNGTACPEIAGGAALLVNPRNTREIADAIRSISLNEDLRNDLIKKGLKRAAGFSWEDSAGKHFRVFKHALIK